VIGGLGLGHVPMEPGRSSTSKSRWRSGSEAPSIVFGPAGQRDIAPGTTTSLSAIGAALAGLARQRPMLCYVTAQGNPGPAQRRRRARGPDRLQDRRPRPPDFARRPPGPPATATTNSAPPANALAGTSSSISRFGSRTRSANTTTKPCRRHLQEADILLNVRPQATARCRTKITDEDLAGLETAEGPGQSKASLRFV